MMIERHDKLSHARQCHILGLARSTYYYQPQPASDVELVLAAKDGRAIPKNTTIWFAQLRHMVFSSGNTDWSQESGIHDEDPGYYQHSTQAQNQYSG